MWQVLRTVVLEPTAQEAVDLYSTELHRFDEAFQGLEWLLVRKPDLGIRNLDVPNREVRLYVAASDPLAKTPEIWVVFEITETQIIIHAVNAKVAQPTGEE